jgi:uncharacterized protein (DUF342 family)
VTLNPCDIDSLLKLSIEKDKLSAQLRVEACESSDSIDRESLRAYLEGSGINTNRILYDELDSLIEQVKAEPHAEHERVVARGIPATKGINASFVFAQRIESRISEISKRECALKAAEESGTVEEINSEDGTAIDFYNESPFLFVSKGEEIGNVIKSTLGEDGIDIHGTSITAVPGHNLGDIFDATLNRKNDKVYSRCDGLLNHTPKKIKVESTLEIRGCVDFKTGNIDFPGTVVIDDGVKDRFIVKAKELIEVRKLIEASTIDSECDIILHTGMAGRERGILNSGGNLQAGYLDGVNSKIGGECAVKKEITNCSLIVSGLLNSPAAVIRGGELFALKGGVVGSVGSIQGVKTEVILASIPEIEQKIKTARELDEKVKDAITKQTRELETFKSSIGKPNPEQATEIWYLESELESYTEKNDGLANAINRLGQIHALHTRCSLTVKSIVYAKSIIWMPGFKATFENDVKGELTIELDNKGKPVVIRNDTVSPLGSIARVIADDRVLEIDRTHLKTDQLDDSSDSGTLNQAA